MHTRLCHCCAHSSGVCFVVAACFACAAVRIFKALRRLVVAPAVSAKVVVATTVATGAVRRQLCVLGEWTPDCRRADPLVARSVGVGTNARVWRPETAATQGERTVAAVPRARAKVHTYIERHALKPRVADALAARSENLEVLSLKDLEPGRRERFGRTLVLAVAADFWTALKSAPVLAGSLCAAWAHCWYAYMYMYVCTR